MALIWQTLTHIFVFALFFSILYVDGGGGAQKKPVKPQAEGSKVAKKQLQAMEHKINEFKATLKKRLADPKTPKPTKRCLKQCQENFGDAIDGVKTSIQSINQKDLPRANVCVSAVGTDIDTCNDCFVEMSGEDKEVKAFNVWIRGITEECLKNLQKK